MWAWGRNNYGQLGLNDTTNRSSPVQVGTDTNWSKVKCGYGFTLAIKTDGTLWSWGGGNFGRLGHGNTTNRSSPVQIGSGTNWSEIAAGIGASFAIKTDNSLWAWGLTSKGLTTVASNSSPVQIATGSSWSKIATTFSGIVNDAVEGPHALAIDTSGKMFGWGASNQGQVTNEIRTIYVSPKQVGTDTNWSEASASYRGSTAIKTNGTLWSWGNISANNFTTSSPVQVGSATDWSKIYSSGETSNCTSKIAVKSTGNIWIWGRNNNGHLGIGQAYVTSAIPGVSDTGWSKISLSGYHTNIIRTNGALWGIGNNNSGQIVDNLNGITSPVQLVSSDTIKVISNDSSQAAHTAFISR